ncbi:uncharacterized protein aftphb isoform X2 [Gasterosteus aculeatus]
MEPDAAPLHSSSPPPPNDAGEEEAGSPEQDEEFGGFSVVVSCSHPVYADPTDSPSTLRQPCATSKPAARQPNGGLNLPVEQSQPRCSVERRDCNAAPRVHLTNGFFGGDPGSGTHPAPAVGGCPPREETGFADFTVFAEQAAHPWCCGFSPAGGKERWDVRVRRSTSGAAHAIGGPVCTKVEHCERRGAALDGAPQEAAAVDFPLEELHPALWDGRDSFSSSHSAEMDGGRETSISAFPRTLGVYASASEDVASVSDDLSFECPSADLEPNVSSLFCQEDQTDWDQTDDDGDELEDYGRCDLPDSMAPLRQSEAVSGFHHCDTSATQETCATSKPSPPSDRGSEHRGDAGCLRPGNLPLSDSFADFCSAPTREDGEGSWAEFKDQRPLEENPGTRSREPGSILQDGEGGCGRNSCQASLSCRIQQLLLASFPEVEVPAVEGEEEVLALCALLHAQLLPEEEEMKKIPEFCPTYQWTRRRVWRPHQDLHDAVGLRFQWGGSHTHRTLLRCLDVETRNIGLLEPTKDCPGPAGGSSPAPPEPSTDPTQEDLPPTQLAWSSRGLSSSLDDRSALNLECFGPEEESTSSNSSRSDSPPPGVDRELHELTVGKLESGGQTHDTLDPLDRLMSATSTSVRRPQQNEEELSHEALILISTLPSLSFMQAKVLMFPSVLLPKDAARPN